MGRRDVAPGLQTLSGPLNEVRFVSERDEDFCDGKFVCEPQPIRQRDRDYRPFFERDWPDYLTGAIHARSAD